MIDCLNNPCLKLRGYNLNQLFEADSEIRFETNESVIIKSKKIAILSQIQVKIFDCLLRFSNW